MFESVLVVAGVVILYLGVSMLNKKVPIPVDAHEHIDIANCYTCKQAECGIKQQMAKER